MKKFLTVLFACLMAIFCFSACKKSKLTTIRLNEVTHSIFYAPLYLAINLGYMEDEGIKIELTNGGGSNISMSALLSNSADVALLGPETLVYVVKEGSTDHPMVFGQLTKRDGSFLIGRNPVSNFNWLDLANSYIIGGRSGGMPAMTLEYVLNSKGLINGNNVTLDTSVQFDLITAAFEGGTGDYCTMFEPSASNFVSEGRGYYVASVGEESGEVPFTCFMATSAFMSKNPELIKSFLRAVTKAYNYILTHTSAEIAEAISPSFDGTSKELLQSAIEKYIEIDAWSSTPAMTQSAFNKLIAIIENSNIDVSGVKFEDVVDNSYALSI